MSASIGGLRAALAAHPIGRCRFCHATVSSIESMRTHLGRYHAFPAQGLSERVVRAQLGPVEIHKPQRVGAVARRDNGRPFDSSGLADLLSSLPRRPRGNA